MMKTETSLRCAVLLAFLLAGCATSGTQPYTAESVIQAQQTQPRPAPRLTPTVPAANFPVPAPEVSPPVEQSYLVNSAHWVQSVLNRGGQVRLEDGSVWAIAPTDQTKTMIWLVAEPIVVTSNPNDRYPFRLTNRTKNVAVESRLVSPPPPF